MTQIGDSNLTGCFLIIHLDFSSKTIFLNCLKKLSVLFQHTNVFAKTEKSIPFNAMREKPYYLHQATLFFLNTYFGFKRHFPHLNFKLYHVLVEKMNLVQAQRNKHHCHTLKIIFSSISLLLCCFPWQITYKIVRMVLI